MTLGHWEHVFLCIGELCRLVRSQQLFPFFQTQFGNCGQLLLQRLLDMLMKIAVEVAGYGIRMVWRGVNAMSWLCLFYLLWFSMAPSWSIQK